VAKAERLADPDAAVPHQGQQEAVTQVIAGVQDRLHLPGRQHPGQLPRRLQRDRPAGLRFALGHVMQERLPPAPATWHLPSGQQLPDIHALPHLMLIERGQRRQLPVDRHRTDV
jgi:hypothetical protein